MPPLGTPIYMNPPSHMRGVGPQADLQMSVDSFSLALGRRDSSLNHRVCGHRFIAGRPSCTKPPTHETFKLLVRPHLGPPFVKSPLRSFLRPNICAHTPCRSFACSPTRSGCRSTGHVRPLHFVSCWVSKRSLGEWVYLPSFRPPSVVGSA